MYILASYAITLELNILEQKCFVQLFLITILHFKVKQTSEDRLKSMSSTYIYLDK